LIEHFMTIDLSNLHPGFESIERDSQAIFRVVMNSMARPGKLMNILPIVNAQDNGEPRVGGSILLALMESASILYLPQSSQAKVWEHFLKFHTACEITTFPNLAQYIWIQRESELPSLMTCAIGSAEFPENSSTLLIEVDEITSQCETGRGHVWEGPGIDGSLRVEVKGLPPSFWSERQELRAHYPCGVDVIFCTSTQITSLPRSTRIGD